MLQLFAPKLVGAFNRKEPAAMTWIYNKYHQRLTNVAIEMLGDSPEVEDLVAEVFAKMCELKRGFTSMKAIKECLHSMMRHACLNWLKHHHMTMAKDPKVRQHFQQDPFSSYHDEDIHEQILRLANLAIDELPENLRQVYYLHLNEELSNAEIAERLGLSVKTVANNKSMAQAMLVPIVKNGIHLMVCLIYLK